MLKIVLQFGNLHLLPLGHVLAFLPIVTPNQIELPMMSNNYYKCWLPSYMARRPKLNALLCVHPAGFFYHYSYFKYNNIINGKDQAKKATSANPVDSQSIRNILVS